MAGTRVVCEHIHLPVQSGSSRVLKLMKRAYTRKKYLEKVDMIRKAIPDVAITTDIIVGFPGETEADFQETMDLVAKVGYDAAYTFQYSPRPMTEAASFPDQLPKEIVQERYERLASLQEGLSLASNAAMVGATFEVLVEGASKKDPDRLTGRTRTNKLVHFPTDGAEAGSFRTVRMSYAGPHHLEGHVVDGRAEDPRRSLSLPLVSAGAGCSCSA
jgi:tRNA-2-methylthio-N6-dimethylallyladenosine synthase